MSPHTATPRIAVVGCGAIAAQFHLPALARYPDVMQRAVLVDPHRARAEALAQQFGAARAEQELMSVLPDVDAVMVLTPARLHVPLALAALQAGKHVLCEKPLAERASDVDALLAAASRANVSICVNNTRRLLPAFGLVRQLLSEGVIGTVRSARLTLGESFDWPAAGDGYFGIKAAGRGVLADIGAHLVDLAAWWLPGPLVLTDYEDDARGGTEASARLRFRAGDVDVLVELSWLTKHSNDFRIEGALGWIGGPMYEANIVTGEVNGRVQRWRAPGSGENAALAAELVGNFISVVRGAGRPCVTAEDVRPSIALIDSAYAARRLMTEPWHDAWRRCGDD